MQLAKPQVHLKKQNATNTFYIHVVTWFDCTKFKADGVASIDTTPTGGTFKINLRVIEDSTVPNMALLTPVVHTIELEGVTLSTGAPFIEVVIINSSDDNAVMGKRKTHQDDADDSDMPIRI